MTRQYRCLVRVAEIWRYPVKSLQGEQLDSAVIGPEGVEGDRRYAIFDADTGFGLTARRLGDLLFASARMTDGGVEITLPDGTVAKDDAALSGWLGRPVTLRSTDEDVQRSFETVDDFEHEDTSTWHPFIGAGSSFRDSEATVVSLVSTGSLGEWDRRRFRSNIVLEGAGEESLVGHRVSIGGAVVEITKRVGRCVMVTRPQPGGLEKDLDVLRSIHRERDGKIAVGASVTISGRVNIGDEVIASL